MNKIQNLIEEIKQYASNVKRIKEEIEENDHKTWCFSQGFTTQKGWEVRKAHKDYYKKYETKESKYYTFKKEKEIKVNNGLIETTMKELLEEAKKNNKYKEALIQLKIILHEKENELMNKFLNENIDFREISKEEVFDGVLGCIIKEKGLIESKKNIIEEEMIEIRQKMMKIRVEITDKIIKEVNKLEDERRLRLENERMQEENLRICYSTKIKNMYKDNKYFIIGVICFIILLLLCQCFIGL